LARALVLSTTPPRDYESVAGDLYEEYMLRVTSVGHADADRWYWSQAIRSVPPLITYSRAPYSFAANAANVAIVAGVFLAMIFCAEVIADAIDAAYQAAGVHAIGSGTMLMVRPLPYVLAAYADATIFGMLLAATLRSEGHRIMLVAGIVFSALFIIPPYLGASSPLRPEQWLVILGAIPAMGVGATSYRFARRRKICPPTD
jgi:hypothetical protein